VLEKINESLKKDEVKDAQKFRRLHFNLICAIFNAGLGETSLAQTAFNELETLYGKPTEILLRENLNLR